MYKLPNALFFSLQSIYKSYFYSLLDAIAKPITGSMLRERSDMFTVLHPPSSTFPVSSSPVSVFSDSVHSSSGAQSACAVEVKKEKI